MRAWVSDHFGQEVVGPNLKEFLLGLLALDDDKEIKVANFLGALNISIDQREKLEKKLTKLMMLKGYGEHSAYKAIEFCECFATTDWSSSKILQDMTGVLQKLFSPDVICDGTRRFLFDLWISDDGSQWHINDFVNALNVASYLRNSTRARLLYLMTLYGLGSHKQYKREALLEMLLAAGKEEVEND